MATFLWQLLVVFSAATFALGKWNTTKFLFAFGDSYTTDGFNISAGVDSPVPGFTSSNGPNWVQFLGGTYNITNTKVFDLASGGATIDAALVAPFEPTVLSIVDQVTQFNNILAPKPVGAEWNASNSLFAFWIGINDVTNVSQSDFHRTLMSRLFEQVDTLFQHGARQFLFLTVPPTNRAPIILAQGEPAISTITSALADYNDQLVASAKSFQRSHRGVTADVFDTRPIFNTLLDHADTFGFVNATGFCDAYQNGTPDMNTQIPPCAPVSSYL
ncbi:hypothetical protein K474DRAFT_1682493 [Panus rudis PR-1116 ss-1]|nr:hypothetical protein K474DRAFT_1682493 [Panus rudis PR-1116 ss-1]